MIEFVSNVTSLIGFSTKITQILAVYVNEVRSAREEAELLRKQVSALKLVLETLNTFLNSKDLEGLVIDEAARAPLLAEFK